MENLHWFILLVFHRNPMCCLSAFAKNFHKYFMKLVQTWQKILVHQLNVLISTLRNMELPSQKKVITVNEFKETFF